MGYDTSAPQKPKITRKSIAVRCKAVLPRQKSGQTTKRPQGILCVFTRPLRMYGRFSARQNSCLSLSIEGIISSILRGLGDSKSPMYFIAAACVTNIVLDYVFMGALGLGPVGAALGTTAVAGGQRRDRAFVPAPDGRRCAHARQLQAAPRCYGAASLHRCTHRTSGRIYPDRVQGSKPKSSNARLARGIISIR